GVAQLVADELRQRAVAERCPREIDREDSYLRSPPLRIERTQRRERLVHYPAVQPRHQPITLRVRDEMRGQDESALRIEHARQHFAMAPLAAVDGEHRLTIKSEPVAQQSLVEARDPVHAARAQSDVAIARVVDLQPVTSLLLREMARRLCLAEQRGRRTGIQAERHEAHAQLRVEMHASPLETITRNGRTQRLRSVTRLLQRAAAHDQAELIASEPGQHIAAARLLFQDAADFPQQVIARQMAAALVDDHEL